MLLLVANMLIPKTYEHHWLAAPSEHGIRRYFRSLCWAQECAPNSSFILKAICELHNVGEYPFRCIVENKRQRVNNFWLIVPIDNHSTGEKFPGNGSMEPTRSPDRNGGPPALTCVTWIRGGFEDDPDDAPGSDGVRQLFIVVVVRRKIEYLFAFLESVAVYVEKRPFHDRGGICFFFVVARRWRNDHGNSGEPRVAPILVVAAGLDGYPNGVIWHLHFGVCRGGPFRRNWFTVRQEFGRLPGTHWLQAFSSVRDNRIVHLL